MTSSIDPSGEMQPDGRFTPNQELNHFLVDAVLDRTAADNAVPDAYKQVIGIFADAAGGDVDLSKQTIQAEALAAVVVTTPRKRKSMFGTALGLKVASLAVGAVMVTGGTAAAATGSLPTGAQDKVATAAAAVGLKSVPISDDTIAKISAEHPEAALCLAGETETAKCSALQKAYARWADKKAKAEEHKAELAGNIADYKAKRAAELEDFRAIRDGNRDTIKTEAKDDLASLKAAKEAGATPEELKAQAEKDKAQLKADADAAKAANDAARDNLKKQRDDAKAAAKAKIEAAKADRKAAKGEDHSSTSTTIEDRTPSSGSTPTTVDDHGGASGTSGKGKSGSGGSDDGPSHS